MSMAVLASARHVARHEAHHAAALCLAGGLPEQVRIDWPDASTLGHVEVDWGDGPDRGKARHVLVAILVGGMTDGLDGWESWPIDPDCVPAGARRDAKQARHLAEYIGIADRATWLFYVWKANQLARRPEFRRLVVRIADELERVEVLTAQDLEGLIATTEETWST
ncbi:MAG TPA: hypothetical protein VES36_01760 [Candidatus Limnocylindrales bacterium]|nr:hypothetical protein [Candidatus Limnocylindrales bacterium]